MDCEIGSCCITIGFLCHFYCLPFLSLSLPLPLAVSTVASAIDLGIVIADASHDLTGHFSFSIDCNAANGFERLIMAAMQQGGRGVPTGQLFIEFRGGTIFVWCPLGESQGLFFTRLF